VNGWRCIDASVAVKWPLWEDDSEQALRLLRDSQQQDALLVGPPHLWAEVTSAIYKRFASGAISADEGRAMLENFERIEVRLASPPELTPRAFDVAARPGWSSPHDAFYVALAAALDCELWTANRKPFRDGSQLHPGVRLLAGYVDIG
jgi:predicted nucleic acid-binding protein